MLIFCLARAIYYHGSYYLLFIEQVWDEWIVKNIKVEDLPVWTRSLFPSITLNSHCVLSSEIRKIKRDELKMVARRKRSGGRKEIDEEG